MLIGSFELLFRARGYEGVAVDLAVRVMQRHPDRLTLVLEDKDILHEVQRTDLLVAVGPHLDEVADTPLAHPGQRGVVVVGVEDDLGHPAPGRGRRERGAGLFGFRGVRAEGWELVLEDRYLVG